MSRQPVPVDEREWLRPKEVRELFGVDKETVRAWAERGLLKHIRTLGGHRRYSKAQVMKLVEKGW